MPLKPSIVGYESPRFDYDIDARWLMAYAAGVGDPSAHYRDSTRELAMHPVFPVCVEWDAVLAVLAATRTHGLSAEECARSVHAEHDLHILRPLRAGERVTCQARIISAEQRKPGAFIVMQLDTRDAAGALCSRTWQGNLFRDVALEGSPQPRALQPAWPSQAAADAATRAAPIDIPLHAAHVYTECSRIWNPIHTDRAYAQAAGLPEIILHGTATLACAISALLALPPGPSPTRVRRLGGRFSGMVWLPDQLRLETTADASGGECFRVLNRAGHATISRGFCCFDA